ncbi:MAG: hypothetical protein ICV71_05300 [Thermoleophilia bacterium]|nr:hypothetical protein [Thermoleophilia bacterium]
MTEALALALGAALAVAAVGFAARPFLRTNVVDGSERPAEDAERIRLEEERDRALAGLKELEFDHRTGKITDADYRALVGPLRREAADALRALERREVAVRATRTATAEREPARVPEPWPPPDEGDVPDPAPTPAPGEPTPGPDEPAPPKLPSVPQTRA